MRSKSFLLLLVVLAAAGAAIGAGLNYALDDAEPEPAAANNEFTFQLPSMGAQQPGRPQTPPGGLGGLDGGLVSGSVVDFAPPTLVINTEAGSATFVVTEETIVSLQRPAAESADVLTVGEHAFIAAAFNANDRVLDAMMIVIDDVGRGGGPLPPGGAFGNFSLLNGEIESIGGGVISLGQEEDTVEVRYADDVTVSTQMALEDADERDLLTPGVEVRVGAQPNADGQLEAALIMIGDLEGFGLGGGFGAAGLGRGG